MHIELQLGRIFHPSILIQPVPVSASPNCQCRLLLSRQWNGSRHHFLNRAVWAESDREARNGEPFAPNYAPRTIAIDSSGHPFEAGGASPDSRIAAAYGSNDERPDPNSCWCISRLSFPPHPTVRIDFFYHDSGMVPDTIFSTYSVVVLQNLTLWLRCDECAATALSRNASFRHSLHETI